MDIWNADDAAENARALARGPSFRNAAIAFGVLIVAAIAGAWLLRSALAGAGVGAGIVVAFCVLRALPIVQGQQGKAFWAALRENGWPIAAAVLVMLAWAAIGGS